MKKLFALLLALAMTVSLFAACGETSKPDASGSGSAATDTGTTAPSTGTTAATPIPGPTGNPSSGSASTPSAGSSTTPSAGSTTPSTGSTTAEKPTKVTATVDKTDLYTLVIKTVGATGDERTGVRAAAGKIEAGTYAASGRSRTGGYEFDFASLGLEGRAWEYLGATVEIDLTGAEPKIVNKPEKSTFCVRYEDITFDSNGKNVKVCGVDFDLSVINYGILRTNTLLNEGGQLIPGWNDKVTINSSSSKFFTTDKYKNSLYFFTTAPQFNQTLLISYADTTYDPNAPLPEGVTLEPAPTYGSSKTVAIFGDGMFKNGAEDFLVEMAAQTDTKLNVIDMTYGPLTNIVASFNLHELCVYDKETSDPDIAKANVTGLKESSGNVQKLIKALDDKENPLDAFIFAAPRDWYLASGDTYRKALGLKAAAYIENYIKEKNPNTEIIMLIPFAFEDGYDFATQAKSAGGLPYTTYAEHLEGIRTLSPEFIAAFRSVSVLRLDNAWDAIKTGTSIGLYDNAIKDENGNVVNQHHLPSKEGGYLIAATIYQELFGKSPAGLTTKDTAISADDLAALQNAVAAAK